MRRHRRRAAKIVEVTKAERLAIPAYSSSAHDNDDLGAKRGVHHFHRVGLEEDLEGSPLPRFLNVGCDAQELHQNWRTALGRAVFKFRDAQGLAVKRSVTVAVQFSLRSRDVVRRLFVRRKLP